MFETVGAFQGLILHVHVARDLIRKRSNRIFDFRFRFGDTANFVPPYITMGSAGNT